jgi:hypothetical protein
MRMGVVTCSFCSGMLARLSPDSACAKNPVATKTATPEINFAAFDIFIRAFISLRVSNPNSLTEAHLTLCDSAPGYWTGDYKKHNQNA